MKDKKDEGKGLLIVVSGPSGSGKSTVLKRLMEKRPRLRFSVSVTTRTPRAGEEEGRHYYFVDQAEFDRMIREDRLLEYAAYSGNSYGTPREEVEALRGAGLDVYLDIEVQGAMIVRSKCPDALLIFLMPPDMEELERRLRGRGTETEEAIARRMARAVEECAEKGKFEYLVINDDVERAAEEISALIDRKREELNRGTLPAPGGKAS